MRSLCWTPCGSDSNFCLSLEGLLSLNLHSPKKFVFFFQIFFCEGLLLKIFNFGLKQKLKNFLEYFIGTLRGLHLRAHHRSYLKKPARWPLIVVRNYLGLFLKVSYPWLGMTRKMWVIFFKWNFVLRGLFLKYSTKRRFPKTIALFECFYTGLSIVLNSRIFFCLNLLQPISN